jgi:ADP-heptose:LPS heptosyltransferase
MPAAEVHFLIAAGKESLVEGLAHTVLPFEKKDLFRRPWKFVAFLLRLRRARFDVAVEAGHWHEFSFTSLWLTHWTCAPIRIGHARGLADRFLTHPVTRNPAVSRDVRIKLELLAPLGLPDDGERLDTTVDASPEVGVRASQLLSRFGPASVVAFYPGARKVTHRWPARGFGSLARQLALRFGYVPLVLWGPGEEETAREVVNASRGSARLAPATDLALLAAIFRRSRLVVTNDTGPMHLAVATGARVIALWLVPDGDRWSHAENFLGVHVREGSDREVDELVALVQSLSHRQLQSS